MRMSEFTRFRHLLGGPVEVGMVSGLQFVGSCARLVRLRLWSLEWKSF